MRDLAAEVLLEVNRTENGGPYLSPSFCGDGWNNNENRHNRCSQKYADLEGAGTLLVSSKHRDIAVGRFIDKTSDSREQVCLPKIQVIVGTKSMEAAIIGTNLKFAKCNGSPSSFYEL